MFISYPRIEDDLHTDSAVKQCLSVIPELKMIYTLILLLNNVYQLSQNWR